MSENGELTPTKTRKDSHSLQQESPIKESLNDSLKKPQTSKRASPKKTSLNPKELSLRHSQKCSSRLDFTSITEIDQLACFDEIKRYQIEGLQQSLAEKKLMDEDWRKAKKNRKKEIEKNYFLDEQFLTQSRVEMKKWCLDQEKSRKKLEIFEKREDFFAVKDARIELRLREKRQDQEYLKIEKAKSLTRQLIKNDKNNLLKFEREEKRKAFLESIEAAKNLEKLEKLRLKKERELQYAEEVEGRRRLASQSYEKKKNSLEKVLLIVSN